MTDKEVNYNEDLQQDEPCTTCLDVALDAAYSGGFSPFGDDSVRIGVDAEWDSMDVLDLTEFSVEETYV